MSRLKHLFKRSKPCIIGMVHVKPLPGTPNNNSFINELVDQACREIEVYKKCNVDSVLIENMHDVPYIQAHLMGPEVTATMTRVCTEIRKILPSSMSCGVQILAGANKEALAVAQAANFDFIRAEGYIYSHVADEGLMNACAGEVLRYRRFIRAEEICIFTDIKKKHCSHSITKDVSVEETAKAAEFFLSDGLVLTGKTTGDPADVRDFEVVKKSCTLPVIIGSGVTADNVDNYMEADGIIVGSHFKKHGDWRNEVEEDRVARFMSVLQEKKLNQEFHLKS